MNIHGGEAREITSDGGRRISYADISPDGSQITYSVSREVVGQSIRVVPALGGQSVEISDKGSGPHWRPDGQRVGYMLPGLDTRQKKLELWSVKPDGSDRHLEYADTSCSGGGRICFAWSPNGKSIAWLRGFAGDSYEEIVVRDLASGKERQLTHDGKNIDEVWWTHQNEIVFSSNRSGNTNLWIVSASGGPPVQVTKGLGPDIGMRVSADGKTLLYLQSMPVRHLWIGNLADGSAHQVNHDDLVLGAGSLSPDGHRIVVPIMDPDPLHPTGKVVIMDREGGNRRQIASGPNLIWNADWSRDGEWIAYAARSTVHPDSSSIYVVRADPPGVPKRIAYGVGAFWMPDGTLDVTGQTSNRFVSSPEGTVLWQSPDSTQEYPAPGGDRVVVDIRHDTRGIWLRPGPGRRNTSGLVFVDSLSAIFVGGARDGSWAMILGEDGTLTRLEIPSLRRQKLAFTFQGLTMDSHIGAAWDQRELLYDESGVSSKIVLIENLK
jgi:Tol biopolymer transport system component